MDRQRIMLTRAQSWLCLMLSMTATLLYTLCMWHGIEFTLVKGVFALLGAGCVMELTMVMSRTFLGEDP